MTTVKVLIVEDEARFAATLTLGLRAEGFVVVHADNGVDGLWEATEHSFDVVILDIMLPGLNGYEVLRTLRARDVWTPVLMLTAKDGDYDQTDAFDLGAVEQEARGSVMVLTAGTLRLDPARRVVERDSTPIELTPREYGVLEYLMRHKDVVVTKNEMLEHVWDAHYAGPDNVVEVYVGYVRRKIDTPFGTNTIQTVRGAGYRLDSGELEVVSDS